MRTYNLSKKLGFLFLCSGIAISSYADDDNGCGVDASGTPVTEDGCNASMSASQDLSTKVSISNGENEQRVNTANNDLAIALYRETHIPPYKNMAFIKAASINNGLAIDGNALVMLVNNYLNDYGHGTLADIQINNISNSVNIRNARLGY